MKRLSLAVAVRPVQTRSELVRLSPSLLLIQKVSVMSKQKFSLLTLSLSLALTAALPMKPAMAHTNTMSEASALSGMAVGMLMAAPVVLVAGVSTMTVATVSVVADGTVWVLERASDGARIVVKVSTTAAGAASVVVGTAITVTAVSAGWVLSTAGEVIAFVPNTLGQALLHHERVLK